MSDDGVVIYTFVPGTVGQPYIEGLPQFYAVDAKTGKVLWNKTPADLPKVGHRYLVYLSHYPSDGVAYYAAINRVYAFNIKTGEPAGRGLYVMAKTEIIQGISVANKVAYMTTISNTLYAVNIIDGQLKFRINFDDAFTSGGPPTVFNGMVYIGTSANQGKRNNYFAITTDTGITMQQVPLPELDWQSGRPNPVATSEGVYLTGGMTLPNNNGNAVVYQFSLAKRIPTGSAMWTMKTGIDNKGPGAIMASPQMLNDQLYFGRQDSSFWSLDTRSGNTRFTITEPELKGNVTHAAAVLEYEYLQNFAKGVAYFGASDGWFHAVSSSKRTLWKVRTAPQASTHPAITTSPGLGRPLRQGPRVGLALPPPPPPFPHTYVSHTCLLTRLV